MLFDGISRRIGESGLIKIGNRIYQKMYSQPKQMMPCQSNTIKSVGSIEDTESQSCKFWGFKFSLFKAEIVNFDSRGQSGRYGLFKIIRAEPFASAL